MSAMCPSCLGLHISVDGPSRFPGKAMLMWSHKCIHPQPSHLFGLEVVIRAFHQTLPSAPGHWVGCASWHLKLDTAIYHGLNKCRLKVHMSIACGVTGRWWKHSEVGPGWKLSSHIGA